MDKIAKINVIIISMIILLTSITLVNAQEIIILENDRGVQKNSFLRGEGIVVAVTVPYDAMIEVWLHNPPGTPGPSPVLFISRTPLYANVQTKLGPKWIDEKAPCGKYQFEIRIFDHGGNLRKIEYRYFDYATNEQPCAPLPPPPPPDYTWIAVLIVGIVVAAAVIVILMLRPGTRPPKERAPIAPPITPPTPPPSAPPKPRKRRPIIRGEHEEEEA